MAFASDGAAAVTSTYSSNLLDRRVNQGHLVLLMPSSGGVSLGSSQARRTFFFLIIEDDHFEFIGQLVVLLMGDIVVPCRCLLYCNHFV